MIKFAINTKSSYFDPATLNENIAFVKLTSIRLSEKLK